MVNGNGRKGAAVIAVISALGGIVLALAGVLYFMGGEVRALEDHLIDPHPSVETVDHIREKVDDTNDRIKRLEDALLFEHPIGPGN